MDLQLSVAGADHFDHLLGWLRREPEFRGRIRLVTPLPAPGEMGVMHDVLTVSVGAGGALSVLALSLKTWFAQPRRQDLRIRIQTSDGTVVEIDAQRVDRAEAIINAALERTVGPGEGSGVAADGAPSRS